MNTKTATRSIVEEYFKRQKRYMELPDEEGPESVVSLFDNDVDFNIAGNTDLVPWIGRRQGPLGVANFFSELKKHAEPIQFNVNSILIEGEKAVAIGELKTLVKKTKKIIDSEFAFEFTIQKNLITRFRLFEDSFAVSQAVAE